MFVFRYVLDVAAQGTRWWVGLHDHCWSMYHHSVERSSGTILQYCVPGTTGTVINTTKYSMENNFNDFEVKLSDSGII